MGANHHQNIMQIIKRLSDKTVSMKSDQLKLFNRINNEMNTLLSKAQEIIRICLSDRNDFISQAESLQAEYAELRKILEESTDIDMLSTNGTLLSESSLKKQSNLKKLLDRSSDEEETSDKSSSSSGSKKSTSSSVVNGKHGSKAKSKHYHEMQDEIHQAPAVAKTGSVLSIPDTCFSHDEANFRKRPSQARSIAAASRLTTIRDTIESTDDIIEPFDSLDKQPQKPANCQQQSNNEQQQQERNNFRDLQNQNRTYVPDTVVDDDVMASKHFLASRLDHVVGNENQTGTSTPLSVKRQLQEHGLLDMTNSPGRTQAEVLSGSSCEPSPIPKNPPPTIQTFPVHHINDVNQKKNLSATPVKYIQQKFTAVESPVKLSEQAVLSSPAKVVVLRTPIKTPFKSPSIFACKSNKAATTTTKATAPNHDDNDEDDEQNEKNNESMDYSFDFREAARKSSKSTTTTNAEVATQLGGTMVSQSATCLMEPDLVSNNSISSSVGQHVKKSQSVKTLSRKESQTGNLLGMTSPLRASGSRKSSQLASSNSKNWINNTQKRKQLKQLTMTQAFGNLGNDTSCSLKASNSTSKLAASSSSSVEDKNNLYRLNVKDEPIMIEDESQEDEERDEEVEEREIRRGVLKKDPPPPSKRSRHEQQTTMAMTMTSSKSSNQISTNHLQAEYFQDYEKVPKKKSNSPEFKHVQVVRKHDERKKLNSFACRECENYWNSLPEDKRPKRMEESCRHRAKYQAPPTPEHYWSIPFPTTQECIERGYGGVKVVNDKDDAAPRRPRRKRPLQLQVNEKKNAQNDAADENVDPDYNQLDFGE